MPFNPAINRRNSVKLATIALMALGALIPSSIALAQPAATPPNPTPPKAVMDKFYTYLNNNYSLWLGDSRSACSYHVDPAGIRVDGSDRFFLAKISRGKVGTACRGVLEFEIMQADCKAQKLYRFQREDQPDRRFAGWIRDETILQDPERNRAENSTPQSQKAIATLCKSPT
jgi:hypothetical protein